MPEDVDPTNEQSEFTSSLAERVAAQLKVLHDLAQEIGGEGTDPESVFTEQALPVRDEAEGPNWTDEQAARAREVAQQFGYGAEANMPSGLPGGVRITEGGLAWKVAAELAALADEDPGAEILMAGSPKRELNDREMEFLANHLAGYLTLEELTGKLPAGSTEFDMVKLLATLQVTQPQEQVLPYGYAVAEGNPTLQQETGQFINIGMTDEGRPVSILRIDREDYTEDETGKAKYRHQPQSVDLMRFVSDVLAAENRHDESVVLITSNTYASKAPAAERAGLKHGRPFGVAMYGRNTLKELGAPVPAELPLHQLPGDLRGLYHNLQRLQADLETR